MLILLMAVAIISAIIFCYYSWQMVDIKRNNSEYVGLFIVGLCSMLMIFVIAKESESGISMMFCAMLTAVFSIKSKLFYRELKQFNLTTIKRHTID
tara:strand:- start:556 stop:843 length:288 start_codon:yes stop_codon:yes gene_type:complete